MRTLRGNHAGAFVGLLNFIRNTLPEADLTDATTEHLNEYKKHRQLTLSGGSWNAEISTIALFFAYAIPHRGTGSTCIQPFRLWAPR